MSWASHRQRHGTGATFQPHAQPHRQQRKHLPAVWGLLSEMEQVCIELTGKFLGGTSFPHADQPQLGLFSTECFYTVALGRCQPHGPLLPGTQPFGLPPPFPNPAHDLHCHPTINHSTGISFPGYQVLQIQQLLNQMHTQICGGRCLAQRLPCHTDTCFSQQSTWVRVPASSLMPACC